MLKRISLEFGNGVIWAFCYKVKKNTGVKGVVFVNKCFVLSVLFSFSVLCADAGHAFVWCVQEALSGCEKNRFARLLGKLLCGIWMKWILNSGC